MLLQITFQMGANLFMATSVLLSMRSTQLALYDRSSVDEMARPTSPALQAAHTTLAMQALT